MSMCTLEGVGMGVTKKWGDDEPTELHSRSLKAHRVTLQQCLLLIKPLVHLSQYGQSIQTGGGFFTSSSIEKSLFGKAGD